MGNWSEYFEDFPEENPANWVNGRFDPASRKQLNREALQHARSNTELNEMIAKAKMDIKARSLLVTEDCPQCGLKELNTYKISAEFYLCECQDCGIYGAGKNHLEALGKTSTALGEGLNWRDGSLY
jgi:hypothetical protein